MSRIENGIKSLAIGSFDGMHVAHRELIALAELVLVIEHGRGTLTPGFKRCLYTDRPCAFLLLDRIRGWSPQDFVEYLRRDYPHLEKIVVGYDFRFGRNKEGTPQVLERLFEGEVVVVGEVTVGGVSVHARTIREFLRRGELAEANRMLGRAYRIDGEAVRGQGIGGRELVPTINLEVRGYQLPAEGVYAGWTYLKGSRYPCVIFLGNRLTTDGGFAVETHLIGQRIEEVEGRVFIEFLERLRPNRRFDSLDALRVQISADIAEASKRLGL